MTNRERRAFSNLTRACRYGVGYLMTDRRGLPDWAGQRGIAFHANAQPITDQRSPMHPTRRYALIDAAGRLAQKLGPLAKEWTGRNH